MMGGGEDRLLVVAYHRVASFTGNPLRDRADITVSPESFAANMSWLKEKFSVVSLEEVMAAFLSAGPLPKRPVLVTFDDGYVEFGTQAWPVLKKLSLPVTVFLPTGCIGEGGVVFWWDRIRLFLADLSEPGIHVEGLGDLEVGSVEQKVAAYKRIRAEAKKMSVGGADAYVARIVGPGPSRPSESTSCLSWEEVRSLGKEGVTFCSHSRGHSNLTALSEEEAGKDIADSLADLQKEVGTTPRAIAYPGGFCSEKVIKASLEAGCRMGFTTVEGLNVPGGVDPMMMLRVCVTQRLAGRYFKFAMTPLGTGMLRAFRNFRKHGKVS